jgi:flagellar biosynthesis/type III secretory pathway chaperone
MENAKEYLEQAFYLQRLIEANKDELTRLQTFGRSVKPIIKDNKPLLAEINAMEREIEQEITGYIATQTDIERVILSIDDDRERGILQKRYIERKKWETIADEMFYSVKTCHALHKQALSHVKIGAIEK